MMQEDKELLLKDLCARLPYKIKVRIYNDSWEGCKKGEFDNTMGFHHVEAFKCDRIEIEPYLRPMSSMTEEEIKELLQISGFNSDVDDICYDSICCIERTTINITDIANFISWLNAHHFDYQGLIKKGLALEAPKDMYK